ncbi:hypothetical protein TIFTF001_032538 [Ficus carica]|uniref:Uncharacterized protein n=1 Tax=Ficus carica TaxID=3494 RepID=A0AA88J5X6_FICCA|nr:hypothetical protein TIFTF001_032538 [Ficus carica]
MESAATDLDVVPAESKSRQQSATTKNLGKAVMPPSLQLCSISNVTGAKPRPIHLQKIPTNPKEKDRKGYLSLEKKVDGFDIA